MVVEKSSLSVFVLAGGVGAARFLRGLAQVNQPKSTTVLVNTGDDTVMHGLNISPDIDTVIYTLGEAIDAQRGWGLTNESWRAMESLQRYTNVRPNGSIAAQTWFNLGDQDLATHLYRTARRDEGADAWQITREIAAAWCVEQQIVPMTNQEVSTVVELAEDCVAGKAGEKISFQEYFVKHKHNVAVRSVTFVGVASAEPNALPQLANADAVVIAPSNPIVSIGPIRALAGVDATLATIKDRVVAISPIVGGHAIKGPADRMLSELGHECSALGVARMYSSIASTLIIDDVDANLKSEIEALGMRCVVTNTIMSELKISAALAQTALASLKIK